MKWITGSVLFNLLLLIIAAAVGYGSWHMGRQALAIYRESAANHAKIEELSKKKQELEDYLKQLEAPGEIERQAKERLNLKLPGEQVVVVVARQASSTQERGEQAGKKIWNWMAGLWRSIW